MEDGQHKLRERLENIWSAPSLISFFEKYSKNGPHLVKKGTILFNAGRVRRWYIAAV